MTLSPQESNHWPAPQGFEFLGELGRGGMGVVYRARDAAGQQVAVKIAPRARQGAALERFRREGETTSRLRHSGIVTVHSVGVLPEGVPFVAYELVEGARSLGQVFAELMPVERVERVLEAAAAVAHAHGKGVVHRDLKPENVLVGVDGKLRVSDFGLALAGGDSRLSQTGALVGTPTHMSPEQFLGSKFGEITPATDVWALGVILYEALTGALPFTGESLQAIAAAVSQGRPVKPSAIAPVSGALEAVCLKALRPVAGERYPNAGAFADALEEALGSAATSRAGGRGPIVVAGVGLLLAVAGGAAWLRTRPGPPPVPTAGVSAAPPRSTGSPTPAPTATESAAPAPTLEARAEAGDVEAIYELGRHLQQETPPRHDEALPLFRRAAEAGHPASMCALALILSVGKSGEEKKEAFVWLRKAAEAGDAQAMFNLGGMLQGNALGPADRASSVRWLQRAYAGGYMKAANNLGMSYEKGIGVEANLKTAAEWYRRGARGGDPRAMVNWAVMCLEGTGTPRDPAEGFRWCSSAAATGHADAMLNLGLLYQQGLGVAKDEARGFRWFERALRAGNKKAYAAIGSSYEAGRGVPKDPARAIAAYRLAAKHGNPLARARLRALGVE